MPTNRRLNQKKARVTIPFTLYIEVPRGWGDKDETEDSVRNYAIGYLERALEDFDNACSNAVGETGLEMVLLQK